MFRDPALLPGDARGGGAALAHLSVAEGLKIAGLQHRRGGLFVRDPAARRGACCSSGPPGIYATDINRRQALQSRPKSGRLRRSKPHCLVHRESSPFRRARIALGLLHRGLPARGLRQDAEEAHRLFRPQPGHRQRLRRSTARLLPQRAHLLPTRRLAGPRPGPVSTTSLCRKGFLGIGSKESLRFSSHAGAFDELVPRERIYQKRSAP